MVLDDIKKNKKKNHFKKSLKSSNHPIPSTYVEKKKNKYDRKKLKLELKKNIDWIYLWEKILLSNVTNSSP